MSMLMIDCHLGDHPTHGLALLGILTHGPNSLLAIPGGMQLHTSTAMVVAFLVSHRRQELADLLTPASIQGLPFGVHGYHSDRCRSSSWL